jgi:hypothetical protein
MKIAGFADDDSGGWDMETGRPSISLFANALQVWSLAQDRPPTENEAALAFNVTPALIREAIDFHMCMLPGLDGVIEHEGE